MLKRKPSTLRALAGLCALALSAPALAAGPRDTAAAVAPTKPHKARQAASRARTAAKPAPKAEPRYFVEFRGRKAVSYGHAYVAFGRLNERGDIAESEIAGLHPFTESAMPWMIGHLIPVPSEVGASDGDLDDQYISARYRVELSAGEYERVVGYIKHLQATSPLWWAPVYNCVSFIRDVARFMGLETPGSTWLYPDVFVSMLEEMNRGRRPVVAARDSAW